MKQRFGPLLLVAGTLLATSAGAQETPDSFLWWERSIWENPDRSYGWYPPERVERPSVDLPLTPKVPERRDIRTLTSTKQIREELDRLKDEAVINPTSDNVRRYLEAQQYVMEKGSVFADVARRVVWETPALDYSLRRPTNALAIHGFKEARREKREAAIARVAAENGLFFFFRSDCSYCHQVAPILRYLQDAHGIEVFAVSLDGGPLREFPDARPDNGISLVLGVEQVPALFLSSKVERRVQALGYGVIAAEEILERMFVLTQLRPGEDF
jgi:conjugal transfer pilus assembly protein TraF